MGHIRFRSDKEGHRDPAFDRLMPLVFAAIAPHGGIAIAEACPPEGRARAATTRRGMEELGRRSADARPEVAIVLTPHNIHVAGAMAVITAGWVAGALEGSPEVALRLPTDRALGEAVADALAADGIPVARVSYGANDAAAASFPMDWAVLVPLWFMGGRADPPVETVVVAPARDLSYDAHVAAGRAIARVAASSPRRISLIASCDHGHGHDAAGPYGFTPKSREFDDAVVEIVRRDDLKGLLDLPAALPVEAKADSYWQMLMLHGALGDGWRGEFLSYEAPTYYGMLCAAYAPKDAAVTPSR